MVGKLRHIREWLREPLPVFGLVTIISLWLSIATGWYFLAGVPVAYLLVYLTLVDFRIIFFALLFFLPLSTEVVLPNGFGTDLPTEPLMIGLTGVYLLFALQHRTRLRAAFLRHPITLLLIVHLSWIFASTLVSDNFVVSLKFFLAKSWYIVAFYALAGYMLRSERDIRRFFWVVFSPLFFVVVVTLVRHAMLGFSFQEVHTVFHPFHRNHVNYAAIVALFLPFIVLATGWYRQQRLLRWGLWAAILVCLVAIYFSFTRAAYVSVVIAFAGYWIVRWRLMRFAVGGAVLAVVIGALWIVQQNRYLDFAPDFERTVSHERFDNLLSATAKGEDISTMERVYRWVAGYHMIRQQPVFGVGPGNFVNFYKEHTVTSFQTYVSDNPERSGIHSYFLMTFVEQGFPGLLFFSLLLVVALLLGERIYHRVPPPRQRIVMMTLLSTIVIASFLLINDLIETDKIGSFFFLNLAILVNQGIAGEE